MNRRVVAKELMKLAKDLVGATGARAVIEGMNDGVTRAIARWASKSLQREIKPYFDDCKVERVIDTGDAVDIEFSVNSESYVCQVLVRTKRG